MPVLQTEEGTATEMAVPQTMLDKIWDAHVVRVAAGEPDLLYVDLHLVHEVTSPQAFEGLRLAHRGLRRPDLTLAVPDHNVPTVGRDAPAVDPLSQTQIETLRTNAAATGVTLFDIDERGYSLLLRSESVV